jgi:hypothetical protein
LERLGLSCSTSKLTRPQTHELTITSTLTIHGPLSIGPLAIKGPDKR